MRRRVRVVWFLISDRVYVAHRTDCHLRTFFSDCFTSLRIAFRLTYPHTLPVSYLSYSAPYSASYPDSLISYLIHPHLTCILSHSYLVLYPASCLVIRSSWFCLVVLYHVSRFSIHARSKIMNLNALDSLWQIITTVLAHSRDYRISQVRLIWEAERAKQRLTRTRAT